jgi:hypothetical protein
LIHGRRGSGPEAEPTLSKFFTIANIGADADNARARQKVPKFFDLRARALCVSSASPLPGSGRHGSLSGPIFPVEKMPALIQNGTVPIGASPRFGKSLD